MLVNQIKPQGSIVTKDITQAVQKMIREGVNRDKAIYWHNRLLSRYLAVFSGGLSFGWDYPTMRINSPETYAILQWIAGQSNGFTVCENGGGI
jgi:hypothetical protein